MAEQSITAFLNVVHPEQREICGPWLRTGEAVMLYAPRGTGKSLFCMSLAHAVATGSPFLSWQPSAAFKVLYLEAEMPERLTQKRLSQIEACAAYSARPSHFRVWTRDDNGHFPNIGTTAGQQVLAAACHEADLIVIDNLLSAAPPTDSRDDDVKVWYRIKPWLYNLRNQDKCILWVHHAGKSGQQLGTSLRENDMDVIIKLTNPGYPKDDTGVGMYLDFDKKRDLSGVAAQNLFVRYENINGVPSWTHQIARDYRRQQIRELLPRMRNKQLIAAMLNCPLWEVYEAQPQEQEEERGDWQYEY